MPTCLACSSQVPADSRFCPRCGGALTPSSEIPTNLVPSGQSGSSGSLDEGRFTAGTILAGRYRIIGLLGRGGMGEVYRADDLTLSQAVALKFLPEVLAKDPARLARFLAEVRIARTISHPNVCRVYDIGEVDGRRFLSMEFVDGEDLSSLLRRIGRFAPDKATEIARQICAGLAAAHDKGVVHRDLKPANVMIDGQGKVRITDFGLAGLAADMKEGDVRVGTPAYMAPEQLAGKEVTLRSDLYALGLILYQMYTGKAPFKRGSSLTELIRDRQEQSLVSPGTLVSDLDPAIERAILRCLEKDPRQRPASALAVAASLPGGDPLAAALAAGETPAPEVVAAAGEEGGLAPRIAWMCLIAALLSAAVALWLIPPRSLLGKVRLDKSPAVLQDRAEEILKELGHTAPAADAVRGFVVDDDYLEYLKEKDASVTRWDALSKERPAALFFWYRQSPRPMLGYPGLTRVKMTDPPQSISGMATVALDPRGRLLLLEVVPPQMEESTGTPASPDWPLLFRQAGLDVQSFTSVASTWTPPTYADARAAWEGELPETRTKIRVEAASFQGRPVYFRILGPWTRPERMKTFQPDRGQRLTQNIGIAILFSLVVGALVIARRNLRQGRGDRSGAFRIAAVFVVVHLFVWGLWAHHVPSRDEWNIIFLDTGYTLCWAAILWVLYIALEPLVRRRWPETLISWTRILSGRYRDPRVGRDVLVGAACGTALTALASAIDPERWLGWASPLLNSGGVELFHDLRYPLGSLLDTPIHTIIAGMILVFLLLLLRILLRRQWLAACGFVALPAVLAVGGSDHPLLGLPINLLFGVMFTFLILRFGLLAVISAFTCLNFFDTVTTTDFSSWTSGPTLVVMVGWLGLTLYGFVVSLGGRQIFGSGLLEDEA
jgi:serine/threonine-protein kinase